MVPSTVCDCRTPGVPAYANCWARGFHWGATAHDGDCLHVSMAFGREGRGGKSVMGFISGFDDTLTIRWFPVSDLTLS